MIWLLMKNLSEESSAITNKIKLSRQFLYSWFYLAFPAQMKMKLWSVLKLWKNYVLDILWKERVHVCGFFYYWLDITDVLKTLTSELVSSFIMVSASLSWIRGFCTFSTELFWVVAEVPFTFNTRTEIQLFNGYP